MKPLVVLILVLVLAVAHVGGQERPLAGNRIVEARTESIRPSGVTISLPMDDLPPSFSAPAAVSFVDPGVIIEDDGLKDAAGVSFETVVVLSEEKLIELRRLINRLAPIKSIARFFSDAGVKPGIAPPDYPNFEARFSQPRRHPLEIRANVVYRGAYHIGEFAEIESVAAAAAFLESLAELIEEAKAKTALLRLAENAMRWAEIRVTTPPPRLPPLPKELLQPSDLLKSPSASAR